MAYESIWTFFWKLFRIVLSKLENPTALPFDVFFSVQYKMKDRKGFQDIRLSFGW